MHRIFRAFPLSRLVAVCLSALIAVPLPLAAAAQQAPSAQQLPDAPARANQSAKSETAIATPPPAPAPEGWSSSLAQQAPALQDRSQDQDQQNQPQKPVGTAAGPVTNPTGVAGARPAGAAIAPGRQRRVKALFIRIGIIVAAAAATGAVIGLSKGSPSRPQ